MAVLLIVKSMCSSAKNMCPWFEGKSDQATCKFFTPSCLKRFKGKNELRHACVLDKRLPWMCNSHINSEWFDFSI